MNLFLPKKKSRKFNLMPHLIFIFTSYVTIACHVIFFLSELLCYSHSPLLSSSLVRKRSTIRSNSLLKGGMNSKLFFNAAYFKKICPKMAFFKTSLRNFPFPLLFLVFLCWASEAQTQAQSETSGPILSSKS